MFTHSLMMPDYKALSEYFINTIIPELYIHIYIQMYQSANRVWRPYDNTVLNGTATSHGE